MQNFMWTSTSYFIKLSCNVIAVFPIDTTHTTHTINQLHVHNLQPKQKYS